MKTRCLIYFVALATILLASCDRGPKGTQAPINQTNLKIAQLMPDVDSATVVVGGDVIGNNINFRAISSTLRFTEGVYSVTFRAPGDTGQTFCGTQHNFTQDSLYVVVSTGAAGSRACVTMSSDVQRSDTTARLRFMNAAPAMDSLSVVERGPAFVFSFMNYRQYTPYQDWAPGDYHFSLIPNGVHTAQGSAVTAHLSADSNYTLYAIGLNGHTGADSLTLLLQNDSR
jgi:hypothetical protein